MKTKAFTLIEVMVVLSILAIIAILAYNFFGGTMRDASMKQAATQLYRALQTIDDGATLEEIKTGQTWASYDLEDLVTAGHIKSVPTPPSASICDGACGGMYSFMFVDGYEDYDNNGQSDDVFIIGDLSHEFCGIFSDTHGLQGMYDKALNGNTWSGWTPEPVAIWKYTATGCEIHFIHKYN